MIYVVLQITPEEVVPRWRCTGRVTPSQLCDQVIPTSPRRSQLSTTKRNPFYLKCLKGALFSYIWNSSTWPYCRFKLYRSVIWHPSQSLSPQCNFVFFQFNTYSIGCHITEVLLPALPYRCSIHRHQVYIGKWNLVWWPNATRSNAVSGATYTRSTFERLTVFDLLTFSAFCLSNCRQLRPSAHRTPRLDLPAFGQMAVNEITGYHRHRGDFTANVHTPCTWLSHMH